MKRAAPASDFVEDLIDAAGRVPSDGEGEDAEHDEAEVAEGGVGGQSLQVALDEREQRAVDDADGGEGDHQAVRCDGILSGKMPKEKRRME